VKVGHCQALNIKKYPVSHRDLGIFLSMIYSTATKRLNEVTISSGYAHDVLKYTRSNKHALMKYTVVINTIALNINQGHHLTKRIFFYAYRIGNKLLHMKGHMI